MNNRVAVVGWLSKTLSDARFSDRVEVHGFAYPGEEFDLWQFDPGVIVAEKDSEAARSLGSLYEVVTYAQDGLTEEIFTKIYAALLPKRV